MNLTVGIVTFNSQDVIKHCLTSVTQNIPSNVPVIIADNHSTDTTTEIISSQFPHVTVIDTGANYGFARGVNTLLHHSETMYTLIVNADVQINDTTITPLITYMDEHPECIVAAPQTFDTAGNREGNIRTFPTFPQTISECILGGNRARAIGMSDIYTDAKHYEHAHDVEWLKGAIWCVRTQSALDIGAMREDFFLYSEEREFAARANDRGLTSAIVPEATAIHIGGESDVHPVLYSLMTINKVKYDTLRRGKVVGTISWISYVTGELLRSRTEQHRYALKSLLRARKGVDREVAHLVDELGGTLPS